jgi:hypothetical protein
VPRPIGHVAPPEDSVELVLTLLLGPFGHFSYTEAQLRSAWEVRREASMDFNALGRSGVGFRPWAFWKFDLGEDRPEDDAETIRLAELGLLRDDEVAAIAEAANEAKTRIGTGAEHYGPDNYRPDRDAVKLHEAVERALAEGRVEPEATHGH